MTPEELEALKKKQSDLYDSQDPSQQPDPVDLDETYIDTFGNDRADDEGLDIEEEIESDEEAIQDGADQQEDPDSIEDFEDLEDELLEEDL